MNITINKGGDEAIIDSEDLIHLLECKIKVLSLDEPKGYRDYIIQIQHVIIELKNQLLALPKY